MKYDELTEMMGIDANIDPSNLLSEALRTISITNKWLGFLDNEKLVLEKRDSDLAALESDLFDYYSGRENPNNTEAPYGYNLAKTEIPKYIQGNPKYISLRNIRYTQEVKVKRIEAFIKALQSRSHLIHEAVELMKFYQGGK